ncbi:MAG: hypothetical protein QXU48_06230 [Thermoplasmata archaeon]
MIKGFVCMSIVFLLLGGLSVVGSGEESQSESLQALIEIKEYIEAQESSVFASENAKGSLLEHLSIAIKFAENGERGKALEEYNRNVYAWFDNYIIDGMAREVLERMTEAYYGTLDVSQGGSGNLGILASTYPQITAATFTNDWNQPYNDNRRVVNFTVSWGGSTDGDAIVYWNSTWNKTAPTQWPGSSRYLGFSYSYQYTITNLPVGNFTNIRIRAFDYQYGGIATKDAKVHNTAVYDKRIALIICGWGRNQYTGTGAPKWSFWNDAYLTYITLKSKGFTDSDIYFLYYNGTHQNATNWNGAIIDGPATPSSIQNNFSQINNAIQGKPNALIVIAVTSHGSLDPYPDNYTRAFRLLNPNTPEDNITDPNAYWEWSSEFMGPNYIGRIANPFKRLVILIGSCYSKDFRDPILNWNQTMRGRTIIVTSTINEGGYNDNGEPTSYGQSWYAPSDTNYTTFFYYLISGLRGNGTVVTNATNGFPVNSENTTDKDNCVSLAEAWNWAYYLICDNDYGINRYNPDLIDRITGDYCQQPMLHDVLEKWDGSGTFPDLPFPYIDGTWAVGAKALGVTLDNSPYPLNLLRGDT